MKNNHKLLIEMSIKKLIHWVEGNNYRGYDPGDGLTSYLRPLTSNNLLLERILQQLIWKSPINLRPLLGVKPLDSCIGRGYFARGHLKMFQLTGDNRYKHNAIICLDWLMKNKSPYSTEYCWGKMFDFSSRGGRQKKYEPITVWTSLIAQAFLDAYEILGEAKYLNVAESVCNWIMEVPRTPGKSGFCINYTASGKEPCTIHNQSMLAAGLLARAWKHIGKSCYIRTAKEAVEFTCAYQKPDGSWLYGEENKYHWIDSFHTAYILDGLKCYIENTGDGWGKDILRKGFDFYKANFFEKDGRPKYYHNRTYPVDSQCASQAIDTLAYFADYDPSSLNLALRVSWWTIKNMQDDSGHFYFRRYPLILAKVPMIHWAQATTFKALSFLLFLLENQ